MKLLLLLLFLPITLLAERSDSIVLKNAVLYYYTSGKGEPIVILSGGPGVAAHQEDDLAGKLSEKYQAILFDQRGTGRSWTKPMDTTTINLNTAIEDLELLRKTLRIDKLNLSGHSWGAMLASAYIARYPQHVKAALFIGGGELDFSLSEIVDENINVRFQLSDTTDWYFWNDSVNKAKDPIRAKEVLRRINWSMMSYDRSKLDAIMEQAAHGSFNDEMHRLMWISFRQEKFNFIDTIAKNYKGRAMIIFGWQDPIGLTTLTQYQKAYPQAIVKGINQCGHMPGVEQPEQFFEAAMGFFAVH